MIRFLLLTGMAWTDRNQPLVASAALILCAVALAVAG